MSVMSGHVISGDGFSHVTRRSSLDAIRLARYSGTTGLDGRESHTWKSWSSLRVKTYRRGIKEGNEEDEINSDEKGNNDRAPRDGGRF